MFCCRFWWEKNFSRPLARPMLIVTVQVVDAVREHSVRVIQKAISPSSTALTARMFITNLNLQVVETDKFIIVGTHPTIDPQPWANSNIYLRTLALLIKLRLLLAIFSLPSRCTTTWVFKEERTWSLLGRSMTWRLHLSLVTDWYLLPAYIVLTALSSRWLDISSAAEFWPGISFLSCRVRWLLMEYTYSVFQILLVATVSIVSLTLLCTLMCPSTRAFVRNRCG